MIPIKLELKNFLSYGDATAKIDFSGHNLICLSGKNGNGKSALLDAMTWALWGNARKVSGTAKADAGLMRLGQTRMIVVFEFLCNDQHYRVRREYAKTYGKPIATLTLELFDKKAERYMPLTETKSRETQAKIERIVGLDFETFINSAFLRQGQSNEFSQKTPKERKQILANILGLSRYDELAKRALEKAREQNEERKVLLKVQEQVALELAKEEEVSCALGEKKRALKECEKEIGEVAKKVEAAEKEKLQLLQKKYEVEQVEKERQAIEKAAQQRKAELVEFVHTWRNIHAKSLSLPDLKAVEALRKELLKKDTSWRSKQEKQIVLQEKVVGKKEAYHKQMMACKQQYEKEVSAKLLAVEKAELAYKQLCNDITQKEKKGDDDKKKLKEHRVKLETIAKELVGYKKFLTSYTAIKEQFEKRRVFYQTLVQRGNWAQRELKELDQKKEVAQDRSNPSCPLCEQMLSLSRKQFLTKTFLKKESFLQHRLARITLLMKTLKKILFEQHQEVQRLALQDERFKQLQANEQALQKSASELEEASKREAVATNLLTLRKVQDEAALKALRKALEEKQKEEEKVVAGDAAVQALHKELAALGKERDAVKYDKAAHDGIVKQLQSCEKTLQEFESLTQQMAQQEERKRSVARLCSELKEYKKQLAAVVARLKKIAIDPKAEKKREAELTALKDKVVAIGRRKEGLLRERGSLENTVQRYAALKKEKKARDEKIEAVGTEAKEYQTLASVFGKDGIQALLIEQAIPEIEAEANQLLSRLTDNKSQVFIESLRDLKKGGVKESLDIHISDSYGIRPYEMFSGGEAFRIDFALRIAISKLLARRAGTALQTLIIDEGFGSQDEEGLRRLMDAIYAIQKDFSKVIVVSHLPVFKDNFPVHFVIEKGALGSVVRVVSRG